MTSHPTSSVSDSHTACDLYPILPLGHDLHSALKYLPEIVQLQSISALRVCYENTPNPDMMSQLTALLHPHNIALIAAPVSDDALASLPIKALDGVHFTSPRQLKAFLSSQNAHALKTLQIGCSCKTLDDAMLAGEQGADYVAWHHSEVLALTQWSLMAELPSVADNIATLQAAQEAIEAGADFLGLPLACDGHDINRVKEIHALLG